MKPANWPFRYKLTVGLWGLAILAGALWIANERHAWTPRALFQNLTVCLTYCAVGMLNFCAGWSTGFEANRRSFWRGTLRRQTPAEIRRDRDDVSLRGILRDCWPFLLFITGFSIWALIYGIINPPL